MVPTKTTMGIILENQAKQLVVESSQTGGGAASSGTFSSQTAVNIGGQWAGVALPLVRKVFGQIAAKEFVSGSTNELTFWSSILPRFPIRETTNLHSELVNHYMVMNQLMEQKHHLVTQMQVVFMEQVDSDILYRILHLW